MREFRKSELDLVPTACYCIHLIYKYAKINSGHRKGKNSDNKVKHWF